MMGVVALSGALAMALLMAGCTGAGGSAQTSAARTCGELDADVCSAGDDATA